MNDLETFWKVLEEAKEPMKLEDAYKKAGFSEEEIKEEILEDYGRGSMLAAWLLDEERKLERIAQKHNSQKHFIRYAQSAGYAHLILLKNKAEHPSLTKLWGKLNGALREMRGSKTYLGAEP